MQLAQSSPELHYDALAIKTKVTLLTLWHSLWHKDVKSSPDGGKKNAHLKKTLVIDL